MKDSQHPISVEELARLFDQHMPHVRDIGMVLDERNSYEGTRRLLPTGPFLSGGSGTTSLFKGVLFSRAGSACGLAVFRALGPTHAFVAHSTSDTSVVADGPPVRRSPGS
jgi:acyl-coenzyme A thioesterase PaaI-like protein